MVRVKLHNYNFYLKKYNCNKKIDILRITDPIPKDVSIEEYEYAEIHPITSTNLNNSGGEITITMQNLDTFTDPSNSYLLIKGRLKRLMERLTKLMTSFL